MTSKVTVNAHRRGFDPPRSPCPNRMLKNPPAKGNCNLLYMVYLVCLFKQDQLERR